MLKIHSKVNTPYGEGILVSVRTEYNGLCVVYDKAECVVWFGTENLGRKEEDGPGWVTREISLKDLIEMNKDTIRNDKIEDILCRN